MNRAIGVALSFSMLSAVCVLAGCSADAAPADATAGSSSTSEDSIIRRPIVGGSFSSTGDPHEVSGDGATWDNQRNGERVGTFTAVKSLSAYTTDDVAAHFMIQKTQRDCSLVAGLQMYAGASVNVKVGVLLGQSKVAYDATTKTLLIDDVISTLKQGETRALALGASIARGTDQNGMVVVNMVSAFGDQVTINASNYINIYGTLSPNRMNDYVRGELGSFDADSNPGNDARSRDGLTKYDMTNSADETKFFNEWTTYAGEALYPL